MKYRILKDFIIKNKAIYLIGFFFILLASFVQTLFPKVLGNIIDILGKENFSKTAVYTRIGYLLLIAAATFIFTFIWRNLIIGAARKLECTLRETLYSHLQILSQDFFSKRKTGDLIAYGINDVLAIRMAFGPATAMSVNGIVICASSIYLMLTSINFKLTLMTLAPIPIVIFCMLFIGRQIQFRFHRVQELFGEISDRVQENINGIRVIKAYVQEEPEIKKFNTLCDNMMDANIDMVKTSSKLTPIIEACFSVSFVLNLILGGRMVLNGTISLGDFIAFNTYVTMIMAPIVSIGRIVNNIQRGLVSLQRLQEILNTPPDIVDQENAIKERIDGNIEFKNLTFYYPGMKKPALEGINLKIENGKTIGIVGKTGSGKTTLANLLLKLYNTGSGQLFLDNQDINDYSIDAVRNSFSFVPQDTFLFSTSIKENIASFKNIYTDDEIEEATKFSSIYESITGFTDGFDTILGERGVNLSGGQKQRISIARAIIRNPSVLILDDSLSAVDTITEKNILDSFKQQRRGKTTLIISHRVSAVSGSDEIIVLHGGKIKESGTHEELINKEGLYYEIYTEQSKAEE
ncbi:putative multidrug resistance ABC transporter ATP-binding/permease protein YheI [Ruminiclostridium hungatei]|uniref:Putative multidrug resistance ABC transporter ATP-binding/permease protein YheI n=1 Tax=Ruminiclostridium hungatei TaxID=48256 RepID=A0A1V4SNE1_RUMHU|nr:ABC transporter ATP-binding protein [Ruminiclostridium hungatei]OPX44985.1 putative multidrug resistance ABC transporter ATP-binding/permease protein YheI [Ruminiclostridium hungatei]